MKKDYWNISSRNYQAVAFLWVIGGLILLAIDKLSPASGIFFALMLVVFLVIGRMFKRHSPKAVLTTYILFGILLVSNLIMHIMNPTSFDVSALLGYVIQIYIIDCARRASKQLASPIVPVNINQESNNETPLA